MENITLYFRQGSSDKVYQTAIEPSGDGYLVTFAYGRRGSTLTTGNKTPVAVQYDAAKAIYAKLIKEKTAKGYTPGADGTPYAHNEQNKQTSGVACQLLNPINEDQLPAYFENEVWWMQQKYDGRRLLIEKKGSVVKGINRLGLYVSLPQTLSIAALEIVGDFLMDGEAIGDEFYGFDLLHHDGKDVRTQPYQQRYLALITLLSEARQNHLLPVVSYLKEADKRRAFEKLKTSNQEGVVFRRKDAPYTAGVPASGGDVVKFKFCETASFVVGKINAKRSVGLLLNQSGKLVPAGNVTIPANHEIPASGSIVEVRYLYAFQESGCVFQPVYLGVRDDIPAEDCTTNQLKYKPE